MLPAAARPQVAVATARVAERAGLDLVSVPDHPFRPGLLDAWAVLAVVAAATTSVRVFPNVANLPLPPAALARTAASLDLLSGGRVELGLGAGAYWEEIAAEGGPRRTPGEAVAATREAIDVIRALWSPPGPGVPGDRSGHRPARTSSRPTTASAPRTDRIDRELVALATAADAGAGGGLQDAVDRLDEALLAHLAYEERELIAPGRGQRGSPTPRCAAGCWRSVA